MRGIAAAVSLWIVAFAFAEPTRACDFFFEEVTTAAGISYKGESWGASWGDYDGDGFADIWTSNHTGHPSLYRNNADGTFSEISDSVLSYQSADTHAAAWGDVDNDGDQDLLELVGAGRGLASGPNHLFINNQGLLQDQAAAYGLDFPLGRGRTPLWLDYDRDGSLDVVLANEERADAPTSLLRQTPGGFQVVNSVVGMEMTTRGSKYAQLSDLFNDGRPDIMLHETWQYPARAYNTGCVPFQNIAGHLHLPDDLGEISDTVIADFNNDSLPDLYVARFTDYSSYIQQGGFLTAYLAVTGDEKGLGFEVIGGAVQFRLHLLNYYFPITDVHIGADGHQPVGYIDEGEGVYTFLLSENDAAAVGIMAHSAGVDAGIFIGFDPQAQRWQVLASSDSWRTVTCEIGAAALRAVAAVGFDPAGPDTRDKFYVNTGSRLEDMTDAAGFAHSAPTRSVVAADFDNDMDLDLYLCRSGSVGNASNIAYENRGDGTFSAVAAAAGAEGPVLGKGDSVTVADYDRDGALDLLLTNGFSTCALNHGPNQLLRNTGSGNHWLEIDLQGVASNRDAAGARVLVTAGGVTQLREQGGGMHRRAQNHTRLHFGLGTNTAADTVVIQWPSGTVQQLEIVAADQILHVVEPVDAIPPEADNCAGVCNPGQEDSDGDGRGDLCDSCPVTANPAQEDSDCDGRGDACDNCPFDYNPGQQDSDGDGLADACDDCPAGQAADDQPPQNSGGPIYFRAADDDPWAAGCFPGLFFCLLSGNPDTPSRVQAHNLQEIIWAVDDDHLCCPDGQITSAWQYRPIGTQQWTSYTVWPDEQGGGGWSWLRWADLGVIGAVGTFEFRMLATDCLGQTVISGIVYLELH